MHPIQAVIDDIESLPPGETLLYTKTAAKYGITLTERHIPPTREIVQNFASVIAKEPVSKSWVTRFINRHSIHLILADSGDKYCLYFDLLHSKINQYQIDPRYTYNMDEKGFLISVIGRLKRIFILACICADGSALLLSLIYEAANKGI
ncbi:hypothetical protein P154DRAFT_554831 [Amniculicola lignicola CBS 123094]|uniref:HTH CENPB-type domain-containing protein n=1 Tax=Amniculicola lignicola CBS 123094 TaxID=1392246 RepID=A0A6A5WBW0_9PLEO|nr:hypothetical protein P154DRAFT_554831 [Amniculicola lignicola CBS 123094]